LYVKSAHKTRINMRCDVIQFVGMEEQDQELVEDLSVARVATLLGVNRDTVRRWLREGRLKGVHLGGRAGYRISREELRRFRPARPSRPEGAAATARGPSRAQDAGAVPPLPVRRTVRYDRPLTPADLEALPAPADGFRRELVRGEVVEVAPAGYLPGVVQGALGDALRAYVRAHGGRALGAVVSGAGFVVDPEGDVPVRSPAVAFLEADAIPSRGRRGFLPGAPALAVEFTSPSDRSEELEARAEAYLRAGSRLVWVIAPPDDDAASDADRLGGAHVWRPDAGQPGGASALLGPDGVLDGEDVLPGFRITLSELWADA
jgi:excisionase family DNA binding protein